MIISISKKTNGNIVSMMIEDFIKSISMVSNLQEQLSKLDKTSHMLSLLVLTTRETDIMNQSKASSILLMAKFLEHPQSRK